MSATDKNKSQDAADKVEQQADKVSDQETHDGQGNAFQINDEPKQPDQNNRASND